MKIKLENSSLIALAGWLSRQPLKGQSSRIRTRFLELLQPQIDVVTAYRLSVVKEYAEVDDKGEYVMIEDGGQPRYDLSPENMEKANKLYEAKLAESYELMVGEDFQKSYNFVSQLVLDTQYEFSGREAEYYDKWCAAFENPQASEAQHEAAASQNQA